MCLRPGKKRRRHGSETVARGDGAPTSAVESEGGSGHKFVAPLQRNVAPDDPSAAPQEMPGLQFMLGGVEIEYERFTRNQYRGETRRFGGRIISKIHEYRALLDGLQMFDVLFTAHMPASAMIRTEISQQAQHVLAAGNLISLDIGKLRLKKLQQHTRTG
jgi:hypothetical protein